jgi:uncharacterized membrane protein
VGVVAFLPAEVVGSLAAAASLEAVEGLGVAAPGEVGEVMKTKHLFSELDHDRITAAIAAAEKHTTGEIRVYVSHRKIQDPRHAAAHQFVKLGMDKTRHRNAVLIFLAPESQNFAILGDVAVHAKCGEAFWEQVAGAMRELFRQRKFTEGIIHGIDTAGKVLAQHFPAQVADHNELSDSIVEEN